MTSEWDVSAFHSDGCLKEFIYSHIHGLEVRVRWDLIMLAPLAHEEPMAGLIREL